MKIYFHFLLWVLLKNLSVWLPELWKLMDVCGIKNYFLSDVLEKIIMLEFSDILQEVWPSVWHIFIKYFLRAKFSLLIALNSYS